MTADCERVLLRGAVVLLAPGRLTLRDACVRTRRPCRGRIELRAADGTVVATARDRARPRGTLVLRAALPDVQGPLLLRYGGAVLRIG